MGYLNNGVVTVDAILTKKGRELLARGDSSFKITQFALSDDEIDYTLYNPSHPSGSQYYGQAIENMPLLEAFPDETKSLKYKLATLPRGTSKLPLLQDGNWGDKDIKGGYTATIADVRVLSSFTGVGINTEEADTLNETQTIGTNVSKTVIGTSINLRATTVNTLFGSRTKLQTTLQIIGRDSGARVTIPITINKVNN